MEDSEVACINLRILGNLQPNQRLYTRGLYFSISSNRWIPEFVHRWAYNESREHAIVRIRKLVGTAETCLHMDCTHSRELVKNARKGITCLQDTYSSCATTLAQLDQIVYRMNNLLQEVELQNDDDSSKDDTYKYSSEED